MSDETLSLIMRARDEMSGAVNRAAGNLDKLGKSGATANSILSGIGSGLGIAGVLGVANAVSTLTDVLGDSVRAAMEDERSVARLDAAMRSAIPGYTGNTNAVEDAIAARVRLGFADDALRDSMGTLVARIRSSQGAIEAQAVALDLARFRGIDLASATDLVGKAWDGQTTALRRAGIQIQAGVSGYEALLSIQKVVGGQAEAYATTSLGQLEAASARVEEAQEALGRTVLPLVAEAATAAADAVGGLADAFGLLNDALPEGIDLGQLWDAALASATLGMSKGYEATMAWVKAQKEAAAAAKAVTAAVGDEQAAMLRAAGTAAVASDVYRLLARDVDGAAAATDMLNRVQEGEAYTATIAATGAWTATSAFYAQAGGLDRAGMGVSNLDERMQQLAPTMTGTAARSTEALDRMIARLRALDEAQQVVFDRMIRNLTRVIDTQLAALDAAQAQRDADRQAIADKRDLADALRALGEAQAAVAANPQDAGAQQALLDAQRRVQDVRDRMAETALRSQEAKLRASLEATKTYIEAVAELERNATNRKALANTLAAREKSLLESRAKAEAAGDTQGVAEIDMKLAAIRAAMVRNEEAMKIAKATTAIQVYTTVHTKISVDGKTLAEIVDKYLGSKPT